MTSPDPGPAGAGVRNSTFHGPTAFIAGNHGTQHVHVYQWTRTYRIEDFPAAARPIRAGALSAQPSRLLRAGHQVVPFAGRSADLEALADWRDGPAERFAVRLIHGPGGQGKTRLAARFAELSRAQGWTVWQAVVDESSAERIAATTASPPETSTGVLLVVDYAERWSVSDLRTLLREPLWHRDGIAVRILLLARPAGAWWESLETWIEQDRDVPADALRLPPLANDPHARAVLFDQARDRFAVQLGLHSEQAETIARPAALDTDKDYAQILTIHIAALAAVEARLHHDQVPADAARASAYLLKRERAHWTALHQRTAQPLSTTPEAMGRTVLTAILTRPLARAHGRDALRRVGLADSAEAANILLDDHHHCYPADRADTVLEPLYPDRLGEDFLGLTTPALPHTPPPAPGAVTDDWAHRAAHRLLLDADTGTPMPWTRDALTVLIETARRWPHVATGQLYPLLTEHPELALQAGGTALATLADMDALPLTVLEAIEPHLPPGRHTDLDVGIAAVTRRLARYQLASTQDRLIRARTHDDLAVRLHYAGLHDEALTAAYQGLETWRHLTRTHPAYVPDLANSLSNLGTYLSALGRRAEALSTTEQAVEILRRLAADDPAAFEPGLAQSLSNLGNHLSEVGRRMEALAVAQQAVEIRRRLAADDPAAFEPGLAQSLSNLGNQLSEVGRRMEALVPAQEAVEIQRRLAVGDPAAFEPSLAASLSNLGNKLSDVGHRTEALAAEQQAVRIRRRLVAVNPDAHEHDLARSLSNLGIRLSHMGRSPQALAATEEAISVYRRLTSTNSPAAYAPELAHSLSNLGIRLSDVGRPVEALDAEQEAVQIRRRLATENPAAYEPGLATSLTNLGNRLTAVGRQAEALNAAEEAVQIRRRLATENPAAYEPGFATSLTNLAIRMSTAGRAVEAFTAAEQTVTIHRRLVADNSTAFEPGLAASLCAWAIVR